MKTFLTIVKSSGYTDVLKKYIIEGIEVEFCASVFKELVKKKLYEKSLAETDVLTHNSGGPSIYSILKLISPNVISITMSNVCEWCKSDKTCIECEGTGETECDSCESCLPCEDCEGTGINICSMCGGNINEDEVLFYTEINLNQGELFSSHFNI